MRPEILEHLRCPLCRAPFESRPEGLRCGQGHAFDRARQGYVNLLAGRDVGTGDTASMVAARAEFLGRGHYAPLATALADRAGEDAASQGLVVELGAGTGWYLARVLDRLEDRFGLALDLSKYAARRAAKAHPRLGSIVADAWRVLPIEDASAGLVLDVFAPRNAFEVRRILRPDGALLMVTPAPNHLGELRAPLGLLEVDPHKDARVVRTLEPGFRRTRRDALEWTLRLDREDVTRLASMGPSARHLEPQVLAERVAALPETTEVTASVLVETWRPA